MAVHEQKKKMDFLFGKMFDREIGAQTNLFIFTKICQNTLDANNSRKLDKNVPFHFIQDKMLLRLFSLL